MTAVWLTFVLGVLFGAIGLSFALWLRDVLMDAERWGTSLKLDAAMGVEEADPYYGLEDVKLRVKPLHDWKKDGEL